MPTDPSFRMKIEDIFTIRGRGTIVIGKIESGAVKIGDVVYIKGPSTSEKAVVTGIEAFRKVMNQARTGDTVGVLLRGFSSTQLNIGDVLMGSDSDNNSF